MLRLTFPRRTSLPLGIVLQYMTLTSKYILYSRHALEMRGARSPCPSRIHIWLQREMAKSQDNIHRGVVIQNTWPKIFRQIMKRFGTFRTALNLAYPLPSKSLPLRCLTSIIPSEL